MLSDELRRLPAEPPRDLGLLSGLRLRNALSRKALVPAGFVIAVIAIVPVIMFAESTPRRLALEDTETVAGTVTEVETLAECRGEARRVAYEFRTEAGVRFESLDTLCSASPYRDSSVGDSIPIEYVVDDPAVHAIIGQVGSSTGLYLTFLFLPLFFLLVFLPILFPQFGRLRRDRRLFRNGRIAPARVLFVKEDRNMHWPGWPGTPSAKVIVQFEREPGTMQESTSLCQNYWVLTHLAPGTQVHVAYDPSKPGRAALLDQYVR